MRYLAVALAVIRGRWCERTPGFERGVDYIAWQLLAFA